MIRSLVYRIILLPLIRRDLQLRAKGLRPDQWYWADVLAMRWGFFTDIPHKDSPSGAGKV